MGKIVLYEHPKQDRYRAVIGSGSRVGWAYPIKQYQENDIEILEAMLDEQGRSGTATFRFIREGDHWVADDSEPIGKTNDYKG